MRLAVALCGAHAEGGRPHRIEFSPQPVNLTRIEFSPQPADLTLFEP